MSDRTPSPPALSPPEAVTPRPGPPVWRQLLGLRTRAPAVLWTAVFVVMLELTAVILGPHLLSDATYLSLYVSSKGRDSMDRFAEDSDPFLMYDPVTGWRNRPDAHVRTWHTDHRGARLNHRWSGPNQTDQKSQTDQPTRSTTDPEQEVRVLLLGNSMINGGTHVEGDQTIAAYLASDTVEALNFGTMLYGLDQVYLHYTRRLAHLDPDVVVVGLLARPSDALSNYFVPLRRPKERNMPYFKPRMYMRNGQLLVQPVPDKAVYRQLLVDPTLMARVIANDRYGYNFTEYRQCNLGPLSAAICGLWNQGRRVRDRLAEHPADPPLLGLRQRLLHELTAAVRQRGGHVLFVVLPDLTTTTPGGWRALLPDRHGDLVSALRAEGLPVLDARAALRASGHRLSRLYHADRVHYSPLGNRVIAAAVAERLARLLGETATRTPRPAPGADRPPS